MNTALLTIILTLVDGSLRTKLGQRLDDSAFKSYRDACLQSGFRYQRSSRTNEGPVNRASDFADRLGAGFKVQLTQEAHDAIEAWLKKNRPQTHIDDMIDELSERNLSPRGYQLTGINYLTSRDRALLHDDMGLGKTIQVLLALPRNARSVVVCPAQVKGNWANECWIWRPDLTPVVLEGRNSFRWPNEGEVIICNYDILADKTETSPSGVVVVADEAHKVKSAKAKRTKRFRSIAKRARNAMGKTWLLTGTPMLNRPGELWTVLQAADLGYEAFGTYEEFMRVFNGRRGVWGIEWGPLGDADEYIEDDDGNVTFVKDRREAVERLASVALGRRKDVVAKELPSKVFETLSVPVQGKGLAALKAFERMAAKHGFFFQGDAIVDGEGKAVTLDKLTGDKIVFEAISAMRAAVAAAKIPALVNLVEDYEENDEPLVVFSAHLAPVETLGAREGWAVITGGMSAKAKTGVVRRFQAGELRGLACTNAAIEGITLTHASHMVFVDRFWTPGLNSQAEDRIHRIGQSRTCFYTDLVADHPVDELVLDLLRTKAGHVETVRQATVSAAPQTPYERLSAFLAAAEIVADPDVAKRAAEAEQAADGVSYEPLLALFKKAKDKGAKYPRFFLQTKDGFNFELAYINSGTNKGGVNVSENGFGSAWYGRINADGYTHGSFDSKAPGAVVDAIQAFQADPAGFAQVYGKATNHCCFCRRPLDRLESYERGYGPVCADKYALPFDHARWAKGEQAPHVNTNVTL